MMKLNKVIAGGILLVFLTGISLGNHSVMVPVPNQ